MTTQNRFYLLLASLIFSTGISRGYAQPNLGDIHEVNWSTKYCASISDEAPCQFCAPTNVTFDKDTYCFDNACGGYGETNTPYKRVYSGDYGYGMGKQSNGNVVYGYWVCDTSQGWVYSAKDPSQSGGTYTCGSDNCISSDWAAHRTGYEVQTYRYCSNNTCVSETKYRCAKNYYGTSTNGTSGCTKCSSSDDNIATKSGSKWVSTGEKSQGFTNAAGNTTAVTTCYIPRLGGSEMYLDSTGAYEFNSNCYWS